MKPFAVIVLLAMPCFAAAQASTAPVQAPTPPPGSLDSSKIRLDAQDAAGALADAETALAHGGGADAYAARADAKRALGRPMGEVIADYAEAAKLDPRYIEKYQGLIAQEESESHPDSRSRSWGKGLNGVSIVEIGAAAALGSLLIAVAVMMLRRRDTHPVAPDDEGVKPAGQEQASAEKPKPADLEQPPKKEPPKA